MQQIGTRVAHLGDDQAFFLQDSGSAGAAHTRTAHTLPCRLDNSQVRLFHRLAERGRIGVVGRALRDNIYGDLRGHLAGGVAAHAVAHHIQRGRHRQRVFIVVAHATHIGTAAEGGIGLLSAL